MEALASQNVIPRTTLAQRRLNKATSGSSYGVPAAFADANRYGYIHPNLPPPDGYQWKCRPGSVWMLVPRGG
eukprot:9586338-Alexandrium_andersonii.AAC.1